VTRVPHSDGEHANSPTHQAQRPVLVAVAMGLMLVGSLIAYKEAIIAKSETIYLRLAPVDPRSLMKGDYMRLRYAITQHWPNDAAADGLVILKRDADGTVTLVETSDRPLQPGEVHLRYRRRANGVRLGAESFLFQEGDADIYSRAVYGELRVSPSGESVLMGLCDSTLAPLGPRFLQR